MKYLLIPAVLILIALLVFFVCITSLRLFNTVGYFERRKRKAGGKGAVYRNLFKDRLLVILTLLCILILIALILSVKQYKKLTPRDGDRKPETTETQKNPETANDTSENTAQEKDIITEANGERIMSSLDLVAVVDKC